MLLEIIIPITFWELRGRDTFPWAWRGLRECEWKLCSRGRHAVLLQPFLVEVFVLSIVLEEMIYCFREFSLWENGLREINSEFDPLRARNWSLEGRTVPRFFPLLTLEDVSVNNIRHVFHWLNHHEASQWCLWKRSSGRYIMQRIHLMFRRSPLSALFYWEAELL